MSLKKQVPRFIRKKMTRLIVISNPLNFSGETEIVKSLFEEGMELFHLRKPGCELSDQIKFLENIPEAFLKRISVHQHHSTIENFGLNYCHVKENERTFFNRQNKKINCSTSFHSFASLEAEGKNWDYCFLSPVYQSISKPDHDPVIENNLRVDNLPETKVFALGGITPENTPATFERGFHGVAVLGTIWSEPEKAIENFKKMQEACRQNVPMF